MPTENGTRELASLNSSVAIEILNGGLETRFWRNVPVIGQMCYALESESNGGNGSHLQATKPRDFCPCKPVQLIHSQYPGQNDLIFLGYLFNGMICLTRSRFFQFSARLLLPR